MQLVTIPLKMPTVWGVNAGSGFRRQPPNASQIGTVAGAASYSDGFVPLNFTAVGAGGVPPFGQDMNGVLYQSTGWLRWLQAGGAIRYDAQFQQGIGGYPAQSRVGSVNTPYLVWQATTDNNLTNPDSGGGGWQTPVFPDPGYSGGPFAVGALTLSAASNINSVGANLAFIGNGTISPRKWLRVLNGNFAVVNNAYNAEIFTLTDAGDISNIRNATLVGNMQAGTATTTGNIIAGGGLFAGTYFSPNSFNGNEWNFVVDAGGDKYQTYRAGGWQDVWNGTNGARSWSGPDPSSPGNGHSLMTLDGSGNLRTFGFLTSDHARLTFGAMGTADPARAVNLQDYANSVMGGLGSNGYQMLPNGMMIQWGNFQNPTVFAGAVLSFPTAFPNNCFLCIGVTGSGQVASGAPIQWGETQAISNSQYTATAGTTSGNGPVSLWWIAIGN